MVSVLPVSKSIPICLIAFCFCYFGVGVWMGMRETKAKTSRSHSCPWGISHCYRLFVSSPTQTLRPNSQCVGIKRWGLREEIRSWVEPSCMGLVPLWKRPHRASLPLPPVLHVKTQPEDGHLTRNVLVPWSSWLFPAFRTVRKFVSWTTQSMVFLL